MLKMLKLKKNAKRNLIIGGAALLLIAIAAVVIILVSGNNKDSEGTKKQKGKEETPVKTVKIIDVNSKSRPYAVMINNNGAVWKYQSGLNDAYITYEMLVEGGITREMALFRDKDTAKIASVRSSRHYFLDYALENDAIYVHWGYSPKAVEDIPALGINNINGLTYEGTYFFRDKTIKGIGSEHKGYTTMESLKKATEKLKYRTTTDKGVLLSYNADPVDMSRYGEVTEAKYVEIPYSGSFTAKFFYNEETKMYERSQNKVELIDYTSKERIVTKNIIVYNVSYSTLDSYGRLDMKNTGTGTGYFISEGKAVPITWSKDTRTSRTKYKLQNGEELVVNDGSTYIGLQPSGRSPKFSATLPA